MSTADSINVIAKSQRFGQDSRESHVSIREDAFQSPFVLRAKRVELIDTGVKRSPEREPDAVLVEMVSSGSLMRQVRLQR